MPDSDADPPVDVDPRLWFVSKRCGQREFLRGQNIYTFPGRMSAFCPHVAGHADYAVSLDGLNDCSPSRATGGNRASIDWCQRMSCEAIGAQSGPFWQVAGSVEATVSR